MNSQVGVKTFPLTGATAVPEGELEAVGEVPGCSATLISWLTVLTAAHCVCPSDTNANNCAARRAFTLVNVFPVDNPATPIDESQTRTNITVQGSVHVHPEYTKAGWLRKDFALIVLDQPVFAVAKSVTPIPVAGAGDAVAAGDQLTLVGFGPTGSTCAQTKGKQKLTLSVSAVGTDGINFKHKGLHACPGDSGGPALNAKGVVVGVASWSNFTDSSTYRPAYENTQWIESLRDATDWQQLSDPVAAFLVAYNEIEQLHRLYKTDRATGDVYYKSRPTTAWERIGGPGKTFVLGRGYSLYGLSPDGSGVYRYDGSPGNWTQIGGPAKEIYGLLTGLYATNPDTGDLWQYKGTPMVWEKIGGPGKVFASDRTALYGLSPDGKGVYRYNGTPGNWTQVGGPAKEIYAGLAGLYATNPDTGDIWQHKGTPMVWEKIGGPGKMFVVGWDLYGLSPDGGGVYRYNGAPGSWARIGEAADRIFAGGSLLCATNPATYGAYCYNPWRVSWP